MKKARTLSTSNNLNWPVKPSVSPPKSIRGTQITILGSGTSTGVPILSCQCPTCRSRDPKNHRTRSSAYIQAGNRGFLIDTSPDLREQGIRNHIYWVDAVLFTHPHADHIHGVDDLRTYNYLMGRSIPCYGNSWSIDVLRNRFDYIFRETHQVGGGKPRLELNLLSGKARNIAGVRVQPLELIHGKMPVLGFRINDIAYITDCSYIPDRTFKYLKNLNVLVLDCVRPKSHTTHLNVEGSLALAKKIGAKKTYFTHMGHELEYKAFARSLPKNILPSYDGLVIRG